jgi:hypothetical protein
MMNISKALATAATLLMATPGLASSSGYGTISTILVLDGKVFFNHTGSRTASPPCATQNRWVFNGATSQGQAMLSVLMTAYATGKQIAIDGSGTCPDWGDTETVRYIATP